MSDTTLYAGVEVSKREGELKSAFARTLRARVSNAVVLMFATAGAPDRSITFNGHTTFWEFKHGTPGISTQELQELMCMKLEAQGHCRYVIWHESPALGQRTFIMRPSEVHRWVHKLCVVPRAEACCDGFDHKWLVEQVKKAHGVLNAQD